MFQDYSIPNTFNSSTVASTQSGLALQGLLELPVKELLRRGNLRVEKCELKEAGQFFELALEKAKKARDFRGISDSIAHLLRHSSEIGDEAATKKWVSELEIFLAQNDAKAELKDVTVIGGGARSRLWGRILASTLKRPLNYRKGGEAGPAYGAARLARIAYTRENPADVCVAPPIDHTLAPEAALIARYEDKLARYRRLYQDLKSRFPRG